MALAEKKHSTAPRRPPSPTWARQVATFGGGGQDGDAAGGSGGGPDVDGSLGGAHKEAVDDLVGGGELFILYSGCRSRRSRRR